jgi:hypothetical protein
MPGSNLQLCIALKATFIMAGARSKGDGPGETIAPGRLLM